jgi:23S rRNA (adenine-N6)-dimethyltransferase
VAHDCVVEIGGGTGVLTGALAARAALVLAIEFDDALARRLARQFASEKHVIVLHGDVLTAALPASPFRVLANPPFAITSALLRFLLGDACNPMTRADLVVQWQVARARVRGADLLGATWMPWWEFTRGRRLPASSFVPRPSVDCGVLTVTRRDEPLLPPSLQRKYEKFVRDEFTRDGARARARTADEWIARARRSLLRDDPHRVRRKRPARGPRPRRLRGE